MKRIATWLDGTHCGAVFSEDERHRYLLFRILPDAPMFVRPRPKFPLFLMLNPSTATHEQTDPTVTRCAGFTKRWGYGSFHVANLFSLRSTDPQRIYEEPTAEGDPTNLEAILRSAREAEIVVCAWGVHGALRNRDQIVLDALEHAGLSSKLRALGKTKEGQPRHPLYMAGDSMLLPFGTREVAHV